MNSLRKSRRERGVGKVLVLSDSVNDCVKTKIETAWERERERE